MQRNSIGTQPACAACKHQRKKCSENCILAPYFPANRNRDFHAVHKIFGVSNITKIVKNIKVEGRKRAVDSLVWEAFCWQKDPILGPYGEYKRIYDEYKRVFHEVKIYRNQNQNQTQILQLPSQGVALRSVQDLIAWNNDSTGMQQGLGVDHKTLNYVNDSGFYAYLEGMRPEIVIPFQQNTQPYYVSGQFTQMNSKSMEGSVWEGDT